MYAIRSYYGNGYNAIRTSHNPPSTAFLDACDRRGMLVIDESFDVWMRPKRPNDYHLYFEQWWERDLQAMILRDRNHPSVIMWSFGNDRITSYNVCYTKLLRSDYRCFAALLYCCSF